MARKSKVNRSKSLRAKTTKLAKRKSLVSTIDTSPRESLRSSTVSTAPRESLRSSTVSIEPLDLASTIDPDTSTLGSISTALPVGQSVDLQQQNIRNAEADGANINDPAIGYGLALPGETGVAAVERIKKQRRKAKVTKKK